MSNMRYKTILKKQEQKDTVFFTILSVATFHRKAGRYTQSLETNKQTNKQTVSE